MFATGDQVDLYDYSLQVWRGQYVVMKSNASGDLIKIRNTGTGSQQFVRAKNLRRGKCPPFFIKILSAKK